MTASGATPEVLAAMLAKADRQIADYDWKRHVDEATAKQDVADATWVVGECRRLLESSEGTWRIEMNRRQTS